MKAKATFPNMWICTYHISKNKLKRDALVHPFVFWCIALTIPSKIIKYTGNKLSEVI